jgi:hypothetical protein
MADSQRTFAVGAIGGHLAVACDAINGADKIAHKIGDDTLSNKLFKIRNSLAAILPELEDRMRKP